MRNHAAWPFVALAGLSPILLLSTPSGGSAGFYFLIASGLIILLVTPGTAATGIRHDDHLPLMASMGVLIFAVACSQAWHGNWLGSEFEKAARFALMALVLAAGVRIPIERLRQAIWGFLAATWYAFGYIAWLVFTTDGRPKTREFNAVSYGDLTLLCGMISLLSLGAPMTRWRRTEAALKATTAAAGFAGFVLTQTRGGWMALPGFALICLLALGRGTMRRMLMAMVAVAAVAIAILHVDGTMRERLVLGATQYQECQAQPLSDTSVCIRIQLWKASWAMFEANPLVGVGGGAAFREDLRRRSHAGQVSPHVAEGYGEAHNDMLYYLASYGVLGGLGLLAAYLGPAWYFLRRMRATDYLAMRVYAGAGLAFCLGFAAFGLSEMMFRSMRAAAFYAIWIGIFAALCRPAEQRDAPARIDRT